MNTYTVTLSEYEMNLLINATHVTSIKYKRPEMTEAAKKGAQEYADLCTKLYYMLLKEKENETA